MENGAVWVLCVADSNVRLHQIARTLKRAGYYVALSTSGHNAVAMAVVGNKFDAVVLDEDMVLGDGSIAESIKAVKTIPILLVCDAGTTGGLPAGVDLITSNGSRQQIIAGLVKLLGREAPHREMPPISSR
jgi:DNA-binding response OmpR family regulator